MHSSGKKRIFIKTDESVLVEEVKKRKVLYDVSQKDYKRQASRQQAWDEVAEAMDMSVNDVKKRWRSMRDAFIKHIRQPDDSIKGRMLHYELMEFLIPYVSGENARRRPVNRNPNPFKNLESMEGLILIERADVKSDENSLEYLDEKDDAEEEYLLEEQVTGDESSIGEQNYKVIVKRDLEDECEAYTETGETYTIEDQMPAKQPKLSEESSDEKFLLSLAPALGRLSHRKNYQARIEIQKLLYTLEFGESI